MHEVEAVGSRSLAVLNVPSLHKAGLLSPHKHTHTHALGCFYVTRATEPPAPVDFWKWNTSLNKDDIFVIIWQKTFLSLKLKVAVSDQIFVLIIMVDLFSWTPEDQSLASAARKGLVKSLRKVNQINNRCFICMPESVRMCTCPHMICIHQNLDYSILREPSGSKDLKVSQKSFL